MKTLYLDCSMGASGDMLTSSLLSLLPDREAFVRYFNALGIPGVTMNVEKSVKCGITGLHVSMKVDGKEEHEHHHDHGHEGVHHHIHRGIADIEHIVRDHLALSEEVKDDVLAVFNQIAMAESHVHGIPVTDIHFHEVGTIDAISDVVAVSLLFSMIKPDEVIASPVATGYGHVETMHGVLPVPAPATLEILSGIPMYQGDVEGELCTPTGAALLKHFVKKFTQMPLMSVGKIGYGMGTKDFPKANLLRAILGEREGESDEVSGLFANVDDMTGEEIGFALEMLFEEGALDVYTTGIGMKKSRPGVMISVICEEKDEEKLVRALFKYTSTLGIRKSVFSRHTLHRSEDVVDTKYGKVRIKRSSGYGVERRKTGYDDVAAIARRENLSICEVRNNLE